MDDYPPQPQPLTLQEQVHWQPTQPPNQLTQYQPSQSPWPPQQYQQQSPLPKPYIPARQPPPPPKRRRKRVWVGIVIAFCLLVVICGVALVVNSFSSPSTDTFVPAPVQQSEQDYKASATTTTVAALDKNGNTGKGNIVYFKCTIMNFVKDSSGNTAGANVDDPNSSGVIQIGFPAGTDLSRLNTGDSLAVWGVDMGTYSGSNLFGATVQEVGISAAYITDYTTGYSI